MIITFTMRNATNAQYKPVSKRVMCPGALRRCAFRNPRIKNPIIEYMRLDIRFWNRDMKGLAGGLAAALVAVWLRVLISIRLPVLVNPKLLL